MFSLRAILSATAVVLTVTSIPVRRDVDDSLVPEFGVTAGIPDPAGSASCVNPATGVLIPCQCPMDRDSFITELNKNVAAGMVLNNPTVAVTFPDDGSVESQLARLQACAVTLQNFNGTGKGCPIAATNWANLQKEIQSGGSTSGTSASATAASPSGSSIAAASTSDSSTATASTSDSSTAAASISGSSTAASCPTETASTTAISVAAGASESATATASGAAASATASGNATVDPSLVPEFGITANTNPTGTGDCDGVNGVKIPCFCPSLRDEFIGNLTANVAAGVVINNPTVSLSFPLDDSPQSALTRLNACLVTLQNQRGTGVGCPAAATTWVALQKSLQAQI